MLDVRTRGANAQQDMRSHLPRVLVVAHNPFTRNHSNGLTLSSLFEGWPTDRLAQLYVPFVHPIPPAFDVCRRFWMLTPFRIRDVKVPTNGEPATAAATWGPARALAARVGHVRAVQNVAYPAREILYGYQPITRLPGFERVSSFQPDLIFSNLGTWCMCKLSRDVADFFGVPVVPFFTDDWLAHDNKRGYFMEKAIRERMGRAARGLVEAAPVALVISDGMAREYERRYGRRFEAFTQCVDGSRFDPSLPQRAGRRVRFVYAGNLHAGRWVSLREIGEVLVQLRAEGLDAELLVYSNPEHVREYRNKLESACVRVVGSVANAELPAIYADADVLVHVESFEREWLEYTRFSLSTKVTEYMMAGRALFGYGPPVNSLQHMQASGSAVCVLEPRRDELLSKLRGLIGDPSHRRGLGGRAREFAMQHHEGVAQRVRFQSALRASVGRLI